MRQQTNVFLKIISILLSIIIIIDCSTVKTGKLISTTQRINRNKILGFKYRLDKVKNPSLNDPVVIYKIDKSPKYEEEKVDTYEKITEIDPLKSWLLIAPPILFGVFYGVALLSEKEDINPLEYGAMGGLLGLLVPFLPKNKPKFKKSIKKEGSIEKITEKKLSQLDLSNSISVKNIPVIFEWYSDNKKNEFKARSDDNGLVEVNLIDDFKITKILTEKTSLEISIKFLNEEENKFEVKNDYLAPSSWLSPYAFYSNPYNTNVYAAPSNVSKKFAPIQKAKELLIEEMSGNWLKIGIGEQWGWVLKSDGKILYIEPEYFDPRTPPILETVVTFDDSNSIRRNDALDGDEKAHLVARISNKNGKGTAYRVRLLMSCSNTRVYLERELLVGSIDPGEVKEVKIPISAPLKITDDLVSIKVETREKHGNNAASVKIGLHLKSIPLPVFDVKSIEIRDGMKGFSKGNGNGRIENGETIELLARIENIGEGEAQQVSARFNLEDSNISVFKDEGIISRINPKKTEEVSFVFSVPRTYKKREIKTSIQLNESRGACELTKEIHLNIFIRSPVLSFEYTIFDGNSAQSWGNKDGIIQQGELIELRIFIENKGDLEADNVIVDMESEIPGIILNKRTEEIGRIPARSNAVPVGFVINVQRRTEPQKVKLPIQINQDDFPLIEDIISLNIQKGIDIEIPPVELEKSSKKNKPLEVEPYVLIAFPQDGYRTYDSNINVVGRITDDKEIKKIEFKINDILFKVLEVNDILFKDQRELEVIKRPEKDKDSLDFNYMIPVQIGENILEVSAIDNDGLKGSDGISVFRMQKKSEIWVVAIGINDYVSEQIKDLNFAVNDAREISNYYINNLNVSEDHIHVLLDKEATLYNIKNILGTVLSRKAKKEDTVIIYFAGHGAMEEDPTNPDGDGFEKYLLPYDADPDDKFSTSFPFRDIQIIFERIKAERLVFILDTCFSGSAKYGARTLPSFVRASMSESYLDRISKGKGKVILAATDANETSEEDENKKHGIFTYYLIKGLNGEADYDNDGFITIDEISQFVKKEVPKATNDNQHPQTKGNAGIFILGRVKK